MDFKTITIAGLGGATGSILRLLADRLCGIISHGSFPLGTFTVNIAGCFLIGVFYGLISKRGTMPHHLGIFLTTGLCGGFTTFSAMSREMLLLLQEGDGFTFIAYLASSIILGIVMVMSGISSIRCRKP